MSEAVEQPESHAAPPAAAVAAENRNAQVQIRLSPDKMEAQAALRKHSGSGLPLTPALVVTMLKKAGVIRGVDKAALESLYKEAMAKGAAAPRVIARGKVPVAEGELSVQWLVQAGESATVSPGVPLAELARSKAEEGFDVTGAAVGGGAGVAVGAAPSGAEAGPLRHDDSIQEQPLPSGGVRWIAAKSGEFSVSNNMARIVNLYQVNGDVGNATGNVKFDGEVRIAGKVNPGFSVVGAGDVYIQEGVESAIVSAGGKAVIGESILGKGKGVVRARAGIHAAFAEQATLLAAEEIRLRTGCVQCLVKTNGALLLSREKGRLAGGVCKARLGVEAAFIGNEQKAHTEISFGQDYLVKDQIESMNREVEKIKAKILDINKDMKKSEDAPAALDELRQNKVKYMKLLEDYGLKIFNLREKFEEHFPSEVRVYGVIYPGVVLESHERYYEVQQKMGKVAFYFDRETGTIKDKPLDS